MGQTQEAPLGLHVCVEEIDLRAQPESRELGIEQVEVSRKVLGPELRPDGQALPSLFHLVGPSRWPESRPAAPIPTEAVPR